MKSSQTAALVVLATLLAGCTGSSSDDETPTASTTGGAAAVRVGFEGTVQQQRTDAGTRRIGLELTSDPQTTVHVSAVRLLTDAFSQQPFTDKDTDFAPDTTIDLVVAYGDPVCRADVPTSDAQITIRYDADGAPGTMTIPVDGRGRQLLDQLHKAECAAQRLDAAASLSYRTPFHRQAVDGTLSLVGDLVLTRPPDGGSGDAVVVDSVYGSVLFEFFGRQATGQPVGRLDPDQQSVSIPVLIQGNDRCDPHARSSSQETFIFAADVRVADAPAQRENITPPRRLQVQSLALLDDVCR